MMHLRARWSHSTEAPQAMQRTKYVFATLHPGEYGTSDAKVQARCIPFLTCTTSLCLASTVAEKSESKVSIRRTATDKHRGVTITLERVASVVRTVQFSIRFNAPHQPLALHTTYLYALCHCLTVRCRLWSARGTTWSSQPPSPWRTVTSGSARMCRPIRQILGTCVACHPALLLPTSSYGCGLFVLHV